MWVPPLVLSLYKNKQSQATLTFEQPCIPLNPISHWWFEEPAGWVHACNMVKMAKWHRRTPKGIGRTLKVHIILPILYLDQAIIWKGPDNYHIFVSYASAHVTVIQCRVYTNSEYKMDGFKRETNKITKLQLFHKQKNFMTCEVKLKTSARNVFQIWLET